MEKVFGIKEFKICKISYKNEVNPLNCWVKTNIPSLEQDFIKEVVKEKFN